MPIARLAQVVAGILGREVIDRTELFGEYDWDLTWRPTPGENRSPSEEPTPVSDGASIFTALKEQLGLTVQNDRAVLDVLVIDHIERPTEN